MRRGGMTRLVQHLGIILVILELAHVPLPAPEYRPLGRRVRADEVCSNPDHSRRGQPDPGAEDDGPGLCWRWAPLVDESEDGDDEDELTAIQAAGDHPGGCEVGTHDCAVATAHRARLHRHFVRGHSKGALKVFAVRSTFVGLADARHCGLRPAADDLARAPLAAMLQRWRC